MFFKIDHSLETIFQYEKNSLFYYYIFVIIIRHTIYEIIKITFEFF